MEIQISEPLSAHYDWPRTARLICSREFRTVVKRGRTVHSGALRISCLTIEEEFWFRRGSFRVGLVVSRRVGGSVIRNRLRRRLREIFRKLLPRCSSNHWIVVVAKGGAGTAKFSDLESECVFLVQRLSLLLPSS